MAKRSEIGRRGFLKTFCKGIAAAAIAPSLVSLVEGCGNYSNGSEEEHNLPKLGVPLYRDTSLDYDKANIVAFFNSPDYINALNEDLARLTNKVIRDNFSMELRQNLTAYYSGERRESVTNGGSYNSGSDEITVNSFKAPFSAEVLFHEIGHAAEGGLKREYLSLAYELLLPMLAVAECPELIDTKLIDEVYPMMGNRVNYHFITPNVSELPYQNGAFMLMEYFLACDGDAAETERQIRNSDTNVLTQKASEFSARGYESAVTTARDFFRKMIEQQGSRMIKDASDTTQVAQYNELIDKFEIIGCSNFGMYKDMFDFQDLRK